MQLSALNLHFFSAADAVAVQTDYQTLSLIAITTIKP